MTPSVSRRSFGLAITGCVAALAGCAGPGGDASGDGSAGEDGETTAAEGDGGSTTTDGEGGDGESNTADGSDGDGDSATTEDDETTAGDGDETTAGEDGETTAGEGTMTKAELDLREANVTGVEIEDQGGGEYEFSVTLYHDDDGEEGYANWWAVETLDGEELGRRELLHEHGTFEFTRSKTVSVPEAVDCVVVRGHDQMHDYGGQAAIASVPSGETRFVDQGSKPKSFEDTYCP